MTMEPIKEKNIRITVRCGKDWKEVTFPVPEELATTFRELLRVEDAQTGSPFKCKGGKKVSVNVSIFDFEKDF